MPAETIITVRNVSKKFRLFSSAKDRLIEALHPFRRRYHHEFWALRDVSFEIYRGEAVGIMGRNGSGKSTLLQVICSVMQPTAGEVQVNGRISALLELGAGFNPEFTGRDKVLLNGAILGFSRKDMLDRLPEIETFADIGEFFDQPMKVYSSGMFARVAFASAIHVDPDVLIVDEILGVGDAKFQEKCYNRIRALRDRGVCILFVSHSTEAIQRNCNTALLLDSGKIVARDSVDAVIAAYHDLLYGSRKTANQEQPASQVVGVKIARDNRYVEAASELTKFIENTGDPLCRHFPYYNSYERRLGNSEAEIIDFLVVADDKFHFNVLEGHEQLTVYVKVKFYRNVEAPRLGWAITSPEGVTIAGSNTTMKKISLPPTKTGECWVYAIRILPRLCGGQYFLNLGIGEGRNEEHVFLDVRRSIIHLSIADSGRSTGFVDISADVAVICTLES